MLRYHTLNYLSEKIYPMNDSDSEEDINYELASFFNNLILRRRDDAIHEGLQAGGVIFPDKAGFKVSERDGLASHAQVQENVSQYLNGETEYSSEEAVGMVTTRRKDPNSWANITKYGFTVRIVATREMLIFIFSSNQYKITEFQLEVIYKLFQYIKQAYEEGIVKRTYINYVNGRDKFVFNEFSSIDEQLDKLENILTTRLNNSGKKTR